MQQQISSLPFSHSVTDGGSFATAAQPTSPPCDDFIDSSPNTIIDSHFYDSGYFFNDLSYFDNCLDHHDNLFGLSGSHLIDDKHQQHNLLHHSPPSNFFDAHIVNDHYPHLDLKRKRDDNDVVLGSVKTRKLNDSIGVRVCDAYLAVHELESLSLSDFDAKVKELALVRGLSSQEKAELNRVREKIINRSTTEKRQSYIKSLEEKIQSLSLRNKTLDEQVDSLQKKNNLLMTQMDEMRSRYQKNMFSYFINGVRYLSSKRKKSGQKQAHLHAVGVMLIITLFSFSLIFGSQNMNRSMQRSLLQRQNVQTEQKPAQSSHSLPKIVEWQSNTTYILCGDAQQLSPKSGQIPIDHQSPMMLNLFIPIDKEEEEEEEGELRKEQDDQGEGGSMVSILCQVKDVSVIETTDKIEEENA